MSILILAAALLTQAGAANEPPRASGSVVVTAERRPALEAALATCLARHCPPDEDAAAALALAESQFVAGDYARAKRVVSDSLGRTRSQSRTYPVPVANLYRARGRLAAHQGEYSELRNAVISARETLTDALSADDPRAVGATIELGDMLLRIDQPRAAEHYYRAVITRAAAIGQPTLGAFARLRLAALQSGPADQKPEPGAVRRAAETLAPLTDGRDPAYRHFQLPAALFLARLAQRRGDEDAIDTVLRTVPPAARTRPILLSADPIDLAQTVAGRDVNPADLIQTTDLRRQWIDIGFWIGDDGGVQNVEVLRAGSPGASEWTGAVMAAIRSRRYAPLAGEAAAGAYRVERYTLTAGYQVLGDSRIRRRRPDLRIEMLDLTAS